MDNQTVYLYVAIDTFFMKNGEDPTQIVVASSFNRSDLPIYSEPRFKVIAVPVPNLMNIVKQYFGFRDLQWAEAKCDAMHFLTSETGEVADALVSEKSGWIRNNPEKKVGKSVPLELGDVLMMAIVLSSHYGIDPLQGMMMKFSSKGFDQLTYNPGAK